MSIADRAARVAREAVTRLFLRSQVRMGLTTTKKGDRQIVVTASPGMTIPSVYEAAVRLGGMTPRLTRLAHIRRVAAGYLEAQKENAVAAVTRVVTGVIEAADLGSRLVLPDQVRKDLVAALAPVFARLEPAVERIVASEAVAARNMGHADVIQRQGQQAGQADPTLYFVVVRDGKTCGECRRVHLLPDGVTPRVWRMSEVSASYHVRGDDRPSWFGMHPRCRCEPKWLAAGYGFTAGGMVRFVALAHDELREQRKED